MNLVVWNLSDKIDSRFLERPVNNRSVFLFHGSFSFQMPFPYPRPVTFVNVKPYTFST